MILSHTLVTLYSFYSDKMGLLATSVFRVILEASIGSLSDTDFYNFISGPSQLSLPAFVDYTGILADCEASGEDNNAPIQSALVIIRGLHDSDIYRMVSRDGEY